MEREEVAVAKSADEPVTDNDDTGGTEGERDPASASLGSAEPQVVERRLISRPILLDLQLVQAGNAFVVKEMAFKQLPVHFPHEDPPVWLPPDRSLHYTCFRHDPTLVAKHRLYKNSSRFYDIFTGLKLASGDVDYSDEYVARELGPYDLVFIKGCNKKKVLDQLFERCRHVVPVPPLVVNLDPNTMQREEIDFCRAHSIQGAKFSFPFVYSRFADYLDLLCTPDRVNGAYPSDQPLYVSNVMATDRKFRSMWARGRSVWVCPYDHSGGRRDFGTQRCAALNLGLLETLWYMGLDGEFRKHLENTAPAAPAATPVRARTPGPASAGASNGPARPATARDNCRRDADYTVGGCVTPSRCEHCGVQRCWACEA